MGNAIFLSRMVFKIHTRLPLIAPVMLTILFENSRLSRIRQGFLLQLVVCVNLICLLLRLMFTEPIKYHNLLSHVF